MTHDEGETDSFTLRSGVLGSQKKRATSASSRSIERAGALGLHPHETSFHLDSARPVVVTAVKFSGRRV